MGVFTKRKEEILNSAVVKLLIYDFLFFYAMYFQYFL